MKSAYQLAFSEKTKLAQPEAFNQPSVNILKEKVWKVPTLPKSRVFLWKVLNGDLPVTALMESRGMKMDNRCQICGEQGESINHILFACTTARQVWAISGIPNPRVGFNQSSIFENIIYLLGMKQDRMEDNRSLRTWPWVLWIIWKDRNDLLFKSVLPNPSNILLRPKHETKEWFEAQIVEKNLQLEMQVKPKKGRAKWKRLH